MRVLASRTQPSAHFGTLRRAAEARTGAAYAASRARRGLLSGILESVGNFLGFGNNQAHPADPKDTGNGATSTPSSPEPTTVQPPVDQPSPPAPAPPASYPAPGGGGQGDKPTSSTSTRLSVSPAPQSSSAGNAAGPAPHSTSPPAAMNVLPTQETAPPARQSQPVSDVYGGTATSLPVSPGWSSVSPPASGAPSPTQSPSQAAQIGRAEQFPLAAAAAIGAVLGFLVVSALFWAVWLALRKRRRAYPEFASVHPKLASVPESVGAGGNPFAHPRDEKEDDPFDAALCRASTARSLASTLSV